MKQFEYNMLSVENGTDANVLLKALDIEGKNGWEAISMTQSSDRSHFNILMKREVENNNGLE